MEEKEIPILVLNNVYMRTLSGSPLRGFYANLMAACFDQHEFKRAYATQLDHFPKEALLDIILKMKFSAWSMSEVDITRYEVVED